MRVNMETRNAAAAKALEVIVNAELKGRKLLEVPLSEYMSLPSAERNAIYEYHLGIARESGSNTSPILKELRKLRDANRKPRTAKEPDYSI